MILILELTAPQSAKLGLERLKKFGPGGGMIGRNNQNDWVLPHAKVSACHARISFANGTFYLEDTSKNGVFLNGKANRLTRGRPQVLRSGDRIIIDPYEIEVSIDVPTPLQHDSFGPAAVPSRQNAPLSTPTPSVGTESEPELDPLALLDGPPRRRPAPQALSAKDLEASSQLVSHFKPPAIIQAVPLPKGPEATLIPAGYDRLAPDDPLTPDDSPTPPPPPATEPSSLQPSASTSSQGFAAGARPAIQPEPPDSHLVNTPGRPERSEPQSQSGDDSFTLDLATVLEGAGLDRVPVTPDLARSFGQILRVVVSGVVELLRARHQTKDEFRMRATQVGPVANNPLKFSANVDDALHNLLVKRGASFLGPVEAFEDAFDDLRNHQLAMLAGMRTAYESMLAQFGPDPLQERFDRQLKRKGSILGMPTKLRYWELYRDRYEELIGDPDVSFTKLFGEEFTKAYEQQLKRLKTRKIGDEDST